MLNMVRQGLKGVRTGKPK